MKTMMPYKYNYPLYLDVNDYNKQAKFNPIVDHHHHRDGNRQFINQHNLIYQREETSPTSSLMNLNAFYDSVLSSGHQAFAFLNGKSHVASLPFHQYFNSKHFQNKRIITEDENKIKSSFSIDSILGINAHHSRNNYLLVNESDLNCMKPKDEIELNYSKTNNVSSVSPDSTAKEQNIVVKHNVKGKALFTNSSGNNNSQKRNINCVDEEELLNSAVKYSKSSLKTETHQSHNSNSANNQAGKSKRVRTIFTPEQLERLESEFERQQYMVGHERLYLASALNLTEAQVKVWFQNRRIKHRKQYFEKEHAMIAELRNRSEDSKDNTTTTATENDENDGNIHDDESIGNLSPINHNEYNQHTDSSVSCSLLSQK